MLGLYRDITTNNPESSGKEHGNWDYTGFYNGLEFPKIRGTFGAHNKDHGIFGL